MAAWTRREAALVGVVGILAVSLIIVSALYMSNVSPKSTNVGKATGNDKYESCHTRDCVAKARILNRTLSRDIDPCNNFYQFTCRNWSPPAEANLEAEQKYMSNHDYHLALKFQYFKHLIEQPKRDTDSEKMKKLKDFQSACERDRPLSGDVVKALVEIVRQEFGDWPMVTGSDNLKNIGFPALIQILHKYRSSFLVDFFNEDAESITDKGISNIWVQAHGLLSPIERPEITQSLKADMRVYSKLSQVLNLAGDSLSWNSNKVQQGLKEITDFHERLDTGSQEVTEYLDFDMIQSWNSSAQLPTLSNIDVKYPYLNLQSAIVNTFKSLANIDLNPNTNIIIPFYDQDFLTVLNSIILSIDNTVLINAAALQLFTELLQWFDLPGQNATQCWRTSMYLFPTALFEQLHKDTYNWKRKRIVEYIFEKVVNRLAIAKSRQQLNISYSKQEKWDYVKSLKYESSTKFWIAQSKLYYGESFGITKKETFLDYIVAIEKAYASRSITTNPEKMIPSLHTLFKGPAQIIDKVVYLGNAEIPLLASNQHIYVDSWTFAELGSLLGYLISNAIIANWNPSSYPISPDLSTCIQDHYHDLTGSRPGEIDPRIVGNFNGVQAAYAAYKETTLVPGFVHYNLPGRSFTSEQLFFIHYAQRSCDLLGFTALDPMGNFLENYVNGAVSNMESFSEAFSCPAGSRMNIARNCGEYYDYCPDLENCNF